MGNDKKPPHLKREKLRQKELKNPASGLHGSNLADLAGGMGWKSSLMMISVLIVFIFIVLFLLN